MRILELLRSRFSQALTGWVDQPHEHAQRIAVSREPRFGEYQANLAMSLAKVLGKSPRDVAQEVIHRLQVDDLCASVEIAGNGFINLRLRDEWILQSIHQMGSSPHLGIEGTRQARTFVIDFSSPNVAKPMHVGHIRSTVIGDSLTKILRCLGHRVITDNHLGDWGTQFGMIIVGYKHFRDDSAFQANPVGELSRLYRIVQAIIGYQEALAQLPESQKTVEIKRGYWEKAVQQATESPQDKARAKAQSAAERSYREAVENTESLKSKIESIQNDPVLADRAAQFPKLGEQALLETSKLHAGDAENLELWQRFLPHCLEEIHHIYKRLNIQFDMELGESFYHDQLGDVVRDLESRGLAVDSDGAACVFLEGFEAPMIVRKKDGAYLYSTTDIATAEYRIREFQPDAVLYVVDHRQSEHFDKLFTLFQKMGITGVEWNHIAFGTVLGEDGKPFKTRSGSVIGLEYLLDEAISKAWNVVKGPANPDSDNQTTDKSMSDDEMQHISQVVGIGAIKYADLMHNRTSDYVFDISKMVQLDGKTSAYIQYSYARSRAILAKAGITPSNHWFDNLTLQLASSVERDLAIHLIRYEDVLWQSTEEYYPSVLAGYLYDLAKLFASFFEQCPVLKADSESLGKSRLGLVYVVGETIRHGLGLLGIDVVERM